MAPTRITYQGIPGSFSYLAACRYFPEPREMLGTKSFRELFSNVSSGKADFGVIPVENSLAGSIHENYDLLQENSLYVRGEEYLKISHYLLALPSSAKSSDERIKALKKVISHPKALEQCQRFLERNQNIERTAFSDTAGAAKAVAESQDMTVAAIASRESAELYGLEIIASNLEDNPANYTRFLIIGRDEDVNDGANKCSLIFTLPHVPASLSRALDVFASRGLNVTKIESRPIHGSPFEYVFYIDFELYPDEPKVAGYALEDLKTRTKTMKVLGFYQGAALGEN